MSEVLQANIFFIIASIGTVVFIILVSIALYQVIRILRSVRQIVDRVEEGSETLADDVSQLRSYVVSGSMFSQIIGLFMGNQAKRGRSRKADNE